MTRQRNDSHSTEFGLWLRQQPEIDSSVGYAATNVDYLWCDFKTDKWCIIEEKRYLSQLSYSQKMLLQRLNAACKDDPTYCGLHIIQFENTNPEDGKTFWNGDEISRDEMIAILKFRRL